MSKPQGTVPIRDERGRDPHGHDAGGPTECRDRERDARRRAARAEGQNDFIRWLDHLLRELEAGDEVPDDGAGMRPPSGDPATSAEQARAVPGCEHRQRQRCASSRAYHERGPR